MRLLALSLATLLLPLSLSAQGARGVRAAGAAAAQSEGARRVLIVGVDEYEDARIPQLRYATVDAMAFAGWLRSPAAAARVDTMIILLNEEATRERVLDTYRALVELTKENDELIFYFAGHGGVREVHTATEGFLLPHDADSTNIARRGISLDDINKEVSYLGGRSPVLLILDACRSGNLFNSNLLSRAADQLGPNIRRLVSSEGSQDSQEGERWNGHGAFTYFLLNGLYGMADANRDGNVTLAELGLWVVDRVSTETNNQQVPQVQPFDHKWVIAPVDASLSDSVSRQLQARDRANAPPPPPPPPPGSAAPTSAPPAAAPAPRRLTLPSGGTLQLGQRVTARLTADAPTLPDSTHYNRWEYRGTRGERVAITMRSGEFDPFLQLRVAGQAELLRTDDDGAGGTDAQIALELPADAVYEIIANGFAKTDLGTYTIEVQRVAVVETTFREVLARAAEHPTIRIGSSTTGSLTDNSGVLTDHSAFEAYAFEGRAGERVEIEMNSTDFDAYLAVGGVGIDSLLARDDDSGGRSDALVAITLPRTGRYVILANSYGRDARGAFTLHLRRGLPAVSLETLATRPVAGDRMLRIGSQVQGSLGDAREVLDDNTRFQVWHFEGRANQRVRIAMEAEDFDGYLYLIATGRDGPQTLTIRDDDSGGERNPRITATLPRNGTYAIVANAFGAGGRGAYTLSLSDGDVVDWQSMTAADALGQTARYAPIAMAGTEIGRLGEASPRLTSGEPFAGYVLTGRAGQRIVLEMRSEDFDAYLAIGRAGASEMLASDDDGAGGTNAKLELTLPADGQYVVLARSFSEDASGAFTLELREGAPAGAPAGASGARLSAAEALALADVRRIAVGETGTGQLGPDRPVYEDGTPFEAWVFEGRQGQEVTITMRAADFDAYLMVGAVGGTAILESDDDSGGGFDAQIRIRLPRNGRYVILANAISASATGSYTIQVTGGSGG